MLDKVRRDKQLEADNGHDGTWIAHPGLAATAQEVFAAALADRPNQLGISRDQDAPVSAEDLLAPCLGERTEAGMRNNLRVALQYIEAWISGMGCVPIYGLMEDAATAEISRTSIWQWIRHGKTLADGTEITKALFEQMLVEETEVVKQELGQARFASGRFAEAADLLRHITLADELVDFLTLPGYEYLS